MVHEIAAMDGQTVGTDGSITVTLMGEGRMFKRRAIKRAGSESAEEVCWLVAEMDGVKVYQSGNNIVISKEDMYP